MIKATGVFDGRPIIMLGLSHGNLKRFLEDDESYILIKREVMGITFDILIFSGKTEQAMANRMRGGIGPDTIIHEGDEPHNPGAI